MSVINFPNILTLSRLVISPLVLPAFLVYLLGYNNIYINGFLAVLFILLSLADFFDGYLAPFFKQETKMGKVLAPIADKFLSFSVLISLLAANKIYFYWVILFIGRDFFVMGIRTIARENGFEVPVVFLGKAKMFIQLGFLAFIILNPYQGSGITHSWNLFEHGLLIVVLLLAFVSAKNYYDLFKKQFAEHNPEENLKDQATSSVDDQESHNDW